MQTPSCGGGGVEGCGNLGPLVRVNSIQGEKKIIAFFKLKLLFMFIIINNLLYKICS